MDKKLEDFKNKIREAVANYMYSEGCSCCQNIEAHKKHKEALGKLLNVEKYSDGSGYSFSRYKTNPSPSPQKQDK